MSTPYSNAPATPNSYEFYIDRVPTASPAQSVAQFAGAFTTFTVYPGSDGYWPTSADLLGALTRAAQPEPGSFDAPPQGVDGYASDPAYGNTEDGETRWYSALLADQLTEGGHTYGLTETRSAVPVTFRSLTRRGLWVIYDAAYFDPVSVVALDTHGRRVAGGVMHTIADPVSDDNAAAFSWKLAPGSYRVCVTSRSPRAPARCCTYRPPTRAS